MHLYTRNVFLEFWRNIYNSALRGNRLQYQKIINIILKVVHLKQICWKTLVINLLISKKILCWNIAMLSLAKTQDFLNKSACVNILGWGRSGQRVGKNPWNENQRKKGEITEYSMKLLTIPGLRTSLLKDIQKTEET